MNKQILKFAFLLLLFGSGCIVNAEAQKLVVWMKSGEKVLYDLEEQPKTTFANAELTITTSSVSVSYPLSQVLRYTYDLSTSGIGNVDKGFLRISQKENDLIFENLKPNTSIMIYSLDGVLMATEPTVDGNATRISLAGYPTGVYLVKAGEVTHKFVKR